MSAESTRATRRGSDLGPGFAHAGIPRAAIELRSLGARASAVPTGADVGRRLGTAEDRAETPIAARNLVAPRVQAVEEFMAGSLGRARAIQASGGRA